MPIGVFDSGLGGLTVMRALARRLPGQGFVYLGDNANAPYGTRAPGEVFDLTVAGCGALMARGCDLVILACNTASAVALRMMQETWVPADARVLGVFVPVIEALLGRPWALHGPLVASPVRDIVLFATPATVASGAFTRELSLRASGARVTEVACPGLVEALEQGADPAPLVRAAAARARARCPAPQAVVLGCTHYPLVEAQFAAALPPGTRILSQPVIAAAALADYLARHPRFAGAGPVGYLTSGPPEAVRDAAARLMRWDVPFRALD